MADALIAGFPNADEKLDDLASRALDVLATSLESSNTETAFKAAAIVLNAWTRLPNRVKAVAAQLDPANDEARLLAALRNPPAQLARLLATAGLVRANAERAAEEYHGSNTVLRLPNRSDDG